MTRKNRLAEKLHRQQEQLSKLEFQKIRLEHELEQAKRKARTHRLITLGAKLESCAGCALSVEAVRRFCDAAQAKGISLCDCCGDYPDATGVPPLLL